APRVAPVRPRLRHAHRLGTDRCGPGRRRRPQGLSGRCGVTGTPLLELRDVDAGYGPFRSLFKVSFAIRPNSVMALLGSNGSGKTTVVRVCSGLVRPTLGSLLFEGDDVTGRRAFRLARLGIIHAPEGRSVFASLSVEENLALTFRQVFGRRGTH